MNHGSLFSGIGGFDLAAEWIGWENIFHCEINEFGKKILKYYWPDAISYDDIKTTDFTIHRGKIDILTGGFPCQPYSHAGKRKGKEDDRHLWPEMLRAIREIRPTWIVGENVYGLLNWSKGMVFDEVQTDLENEGYEVTAYILPACGVNAPHRRDRIWFIANAKNNRRKSESWRNRDGESGRILSQGIIKRSKSFGSGDVNPNNSNARNKDMQKRENRIYESEFITDTPKIGIQGRGTTGEQEPSTHERQGLFMRSGSGTDWAEWPTQSPICSRNDGLSGELDGITFSKWRNESIKGYGNAVVPQVVYQIFKAIELIHHEKITERIDP